MKTVLWFVMCACVGVVVCAAGGCDDNRTEAEKRDDAAKRAAESKAMNLELSVKSFSESGVKRWLRYPDDASFDWGLDDERANADRSGFYLAGKVKAVNAFGAKLTHRWETIVVVRGNELTLASLAIDGVVKYSDPALLVFLEDKKAAKDRAAARDAQDRKDQQDRIAAVAKARKDIPELEQQLTAKRAAKVAAERGVTAAQKRLADAQAGAVAARQAAGYAAAKARVDAADAKCQALRGSDPAGQLPRAASELLTAKTALQRIVTEADKGAGVAAAQDAVIVARKGVTECETAIAVLESSLAAAYELVKSP